MNTGTNVKNNDSVYNLMHKEPYTIKIYPEDIKLSKQCMREGFFKAGVPFAVGVHLFTSFLHKKGILKNPPSLFVKVISFPVNVFCGVYLFFLPICHKRLKAQAEAREQLKNQNKDLLPEQDIFYSKLGELSSNTINDTKSLDSESYFSPLNLEYESLKTQSFDSLHGKNQKIKETTYDELRQQNRENYQKQLYEPYQSRSSTLDLKNTTAPIFEGSAKSEVGPRKLKNKYGDDVE